MAQEKSEFAAFVVDQMQGVGPIHAKRMFGGSGLFLGDLMIGLISDNNLYLKVDRQSKSQFEAQGLLPFMFERAGKPVTMSYFQAPEEVSEDAEAMTRWDGEAYAAAMRAATSKKKR